MRPTFLKAILVTAIAVVLVGVTSTRAAAQGAVITNGSGVYLGVNAEGHLNFTDGVTTSVNGTGGAIGVSFLANYTGGGADIRDATSPGCLCEGFGVAVTTAAAVTHSGYANISSDGGANNLTVAAPIASTASTAVATAELTTLPGLDIVHDYHPSTSPSLYEATVTITNNTGGALTNLLYRRVMDWDVPPTEFSEFVTLQGAGLGDLVNSSDDGFETANATEACSAILFANANAVDSGPTDHGACFTFNFGGLAAGASKSFKIYYGAAPTEAAALAALAAVGAEGIYSFGQNSNPGGSTVGSPATFIFGFGGVGAPPIGGVIPEPATLLLVGTGLAGAVRARYRNRKKQQA